MSHKKLVNLSEYNLYEHFSTLKVAPKILNVKAIVNMLEIETVKYPMTLSEYVDGGGDLETFQDQISRLISINHKNKILHGDLHSNNIVVNPETHKVRIIDFGESREFNYIYDLDQLNRFLQPENPFQSLNDVIEFEKEMYLRDFKNF